MPNLLTMPADTIFAPYEARLTAKRAKEHVVVNYRRIARRFLEWCAETGIDPAAATPGDLDVYFGTFGAYAPTTVRHHFTYIRAAYRSAFRRKAIAANPVVDIALPKIPDKDPVIISNADLRALRDNCIDAKTLLLWHLLVYTGMRRTEIRRLTWGDVNLQTHQLRVHGKGDKIRLVPMHPDLELHLAHQPMQGMIASPVLPGRGGKPAADASIEYWMAAMRNGLPDDLVARCHDFRRTVASSLYRNGVDTMTIDKILGWAPSAMRSRYINLTLGDQLHAAILRLYVDDPL